MLNTSPEFENCQELKPTQSLWVFTLPFWNKSMANGAYRAVLQSLGICNRAASLVHLGRTWSTTKAFSAKSKPFFSSNAFVIEETRLMCDKVEGSWYVYIYIYKHSTPDFLLTLTQHAFIKPKHAVFQNAFLFFTFFHPSSKVPGVEEAKVEAIHTQEAQE